MANVGKLPIIHWTSLKYILHTTIYIVIKLTFHF